METQLWLNFANKTAYSRPDVLTYYQNLDVLFETENVLFEKLLPTIKDSKILDLGIGGGRTTKHLLKIAMTIRGSIMLLNSPKKPAENILKQKFCVATPET